MLQKSLILLSVVACVCGASVKREEFNPESLLAIANGNRDSSSAATSNNSPVYSSNSYPSYSASYGTPPGLSSANQNVASNYGAQPDANANQAYVDNVAAATSNLQSSNLQIAQPSQPNYSSNNQGNLYYYYYPVNDKSKEINYQASPSNQYTSSIVQPQSGDDQSNQNNGNLQNGQQVGNSPGHAGHDLSYGGAQDLAYTASALNENSNNAQSAGSYESQLSNLASSLNGQYGYGTNGGAFGSQFASQLSGLNNLNFGEAFGGSIPQPSSVPFDPTFAAMANQFGGFQPTGQSGSGSSGGPFSQLYQQATQVYQGLINGAGSSQPQFAASQSHPSYEPSTGGGSSFRSKYGLSTLIMPLMALGALSLLIPTFQSLSTVASRKKRSAEDNLNLQQAGLGGYLERIDRYYTLYKNSIERDECINRIICELGDAVSGVRGKDAFFDFVERMMPLSKGNSKVSIFKRSALSADNDKCKHFKCH